MSHREGEMSPYPSISQPVSGRPHPVPLLWQELKQLLALAAPLSAIHAGNQLMSLVDTAIVGRLGAVPLGAVGLANALFLWFSVLGMGVMMSLDPLVSQALGAGNERRARELVWQGVWLALLVGGALSLPVLLSPLLLRPFGIDAEIARAARIYLWVRLPGLIPFLLFAGLRSYLQAIGHTRPMILAMVLGNLFNAGATFLLVFGGAGLPAWMGFLRVVPALGVAGAALATVLCTLLQLGVVAWAVRAVPVSGPPAQRRPRRQDLVRALRLGVPIGLQMASEVGIFTLVGLLAGKLGERELAAHQVALTLASFSYTMALGVGAAGAVRVGHAIGGGDAAGTRRAGLVAFLGGGGLMALWAPLLWLFPGALAGLLTDQPEVISMAIPLLSVAAFFQISDGIQAVGAGVLRGAGDTRLPFFANLAGHYAVGLPVAVLLGFVFHQGVFGLWWGLFAGLSAVAVGLFWRFLRLSSERIKPVESGRP